ncbi:methyltransferase domain-containing protein [Lyngbya aestuarii]|uniref:methyltransferase domain-containing protein n=1 Tax=Lyngbya aestuarii TaxID=118322 RepID=UPI00403D83FB
MFEKQPQALQQKVKSLAQRSLKLSDPSGWFEVLYTEANGNFSQVPWARLTTHPYLQDWLDTYHTPGNNRCALVIGCGLGDDAEALAKLGFQVTAFDISPTAVAWCHQRFPNSSVNYLVADLLALDPSWCHAFDLVFESRNIQALPLSVRSQVIKSIAPLVAPGGTLLIITRFRDTDAEPDGPPWPLSDQELALFQELGLQEIRRDTFCESNNDTIKQLRLEYYFGQG